METCEICKSRKIQRNQVHRFHDIFECQDCGNWNFKLIEDCCRNPNEIITVDRRGFSWRCIRKQCSNCGGCLTMNKSPKFEDFADQIRDVFSLSAIDSWKNERRKESNYLFEGKKVAKRYRYLEYLSSYQWKEKRKLVLARENNLCQGCMTSPAIDIHHITYANLYDEPLVDLQALCRKCHEIAHEKISTVHEDIN